MNFHYESLKFIALKMKEKVMVKDTCTGTGHSFKTGYHGMPFYPLTDTECNKTQRIDS